MLLTAFWDSSQRLIAVRRSAMKLRIKVNSLRLRVTPSEVNQLLREGVIRGYVQFTSAPEDRLTMRSSVACGLTATVAYHSGNITVSVPQVELKRWAGGDDIGIYSELALGGDQVPSVAVEKDFACLDLSDAENEDTFPNPNLAAVS
jgi:hypothetical protein